MLHDEIGEYFTIKPAGFIDRNGDVLLKVNVIIELSEEFDFTNVDDMDSLLDEAAAFNNGLALLPNFDGESYYAIDKTGKRVNDYKITDSAAIDKKDYIKVQNEAGNQVLINLDGRRLIESEGNIIDYGDNSFIGIKRYGKWGFVNYDGQVMIDFRFDDIRQFSNGFAPLKLNEKWGYVNEKGEVAIEPKYNAVWLFSEGLAQVQTDDYKWGYINETGVMVFAPIYNITRPFKNDTAFVYADEGYTFINKDNQPILPYSERLGEEIVNGVVAAREKGEWGLMNNKGEFIIEPIYNQLYFENGYYTVERNGKWGRIDNKGIETIPLSKDIN